MKERSCIYFTKNHTYFIVYNTLLASKRLHNSTILTLNSFIKRHVGTRSSFTYRQDVSRYYALLEQRSNLAFFLTPISRLG